MIESKLVSGECSNLRCRNRIGEGGFHRTVIDNDEGTIELQLCGPCKKVLDQEIIDVHQGS